MSSAHLAQHVEDWRIAVDEGSPVGMVRYERNGEQARDLLRGGVLRGKGASITLRAAYRFPALWQEARRVYGVAQERAITDPSPLQIRAIIHQRLPNAWWNSTLLQILSFTTRSLYQSVSEKRQGTESTFAISALDLSSRTISDMKSLREKWPILLSHRT